MSRKNLQISLSFSFQQPRSCCLAPQIGQDYGLTSHPAVAKLLGRYQEERFSWLFEQVLGVAYSQKEGFEIEYRMRS